MKGFHGICKDCTVVKRTSFTGQDGRPVFQMQLEGYGFNHTFTTSDPAESALWPPLNAEVDVTAKMEPMKTGGFKLGVMMFNERRATVPAGKATVGA